MPLANVPKHLGFPSKNPASSGYLCLLSSCFSLFYPTIPGFFPHNPFYGGTEAFSSQRWKITLNKDVKVFKIYINIQVLTSTASSVMHNVLLSLQQFHLWLQLSKANFEVWYSHKKKKERYFLPVLLTSTRNPTLELKNVSQAKKNYSLLLLVSFFGDSFRNLHKLAEFDFILRYVEW